MTQFTVNQMRSAAATYRDLASKLEAAADSLSKVNPNVLIVIGEKSEASTSSATGVEQIREAIGKAGKPLAKKEIGKALNGSIKPDTLTAYLSKNKGIFTNPSRGVWGLVEWNQEKSRE